MKAPRLPRLILMLCLVLPPWSTAASCSKPDEPSEARARDTTAPEPRASATQLPPEVAGRAVAPEPRAPAHPLRLGYSDWPGWVAWDIARAKGWFAEAGVEVELEWYEYVPSIEAFGAGRLDAVSMTNGDALIARSQGLPSVAILANDFSSGNDMVVARPGIDDVRALVGKKIGVEVGFAGHLLLMNALSSAQLSVRDVQIVNVPSDLTPQSLEKGTVDAIATWQPNSGQALRRVSGAKAIYTSRQTAGLIYHVLAVAPDSLAERRDDWRRVASVWMRVADFVDDEKTRDEAATIMAERVGLTTGEFARLMNGTTYLGLQENLEHFQKGDTLLSVYHSNEVSDSFLVEHGMYKTPVATDALLDRTLLDELASETAKAKAKTNAR